MFVVKGNPPFTNSKPAVKLALLVYVFIWSVLQLDKRRFNKSLHSVLSFSSTTLLPCFSAPQRRQICLLFQQPYLHIPTEYTSALAYSKEAALPSLRVYYTTHIIAEVCSSKPATRVALVNHIQNIYMNVHSQRPPLLDTYFRRNPTEQKKHRRQKSPPEP